MYQFVLNNVKGIFRKSKIEPVREKRYKLAQILIFWKIHFKRLMSFIGHILITTTFQPLRLIRIDADIVQHINLSEIRSVTNSNTRSFALPWQPLAQF